MDWSMKRRVLAVLAVIAVIGVFIIFPYWITHLEAPSCFDRKQNQSEEGRDCGGPCALACPGTMQDLKILWTKVFPVRPGTYDVVAYAENPNFTVGAPKIYYVARLYDDSGATIAERRGETYALPNERFAIFSGGMQTGAKIAKEGSITLEPGFNWVKASYIRTIFSIENKVLISPDRNPRLSAIIHNDTTDIYRNIDVSAIIYDKQGSPIAVSKTTVEKLAPEGTEDVFFTWPGPLVYSAESGACETPVDIVLATDRSGSMRADNKLEQAKKAAAEFVPKLTSRDQGAYVSFATDASRPIDQPLTAQFERLNRAIAATKIREGTLQYTNIGDAMRKAIDELATQRHNPDAKPVIVLLTDGEPTMPKDPSGKDKNYPATYAQIVADEAKQEGIAIYTIGLGDDVNAKLLTSMANAPENYYFAANGAELSSIYDKIATAMCKKAPSVIEVLPRVNFLIQ